MSEIENVVMNETELDEVVGGVSKDKAFKKNGCTYYVIQSGDTLTKISNAFGTSVNQLCVWNNISNPDKIVANKTIRVR